MSRHNGGFTIVELLIAGFILTVVLGLSGVFLARQSDLNRRTQAKAEVQDKVRMVMQVVSSDLALAGANVYADASGALQTVSPALASCPTLGSIDTCLAGWNAGGGASTQDQLSATYITTLFPPATACREVAYRFNGADLERLDRNCSGALINPTGTVTGFDTLATNVVALDVRYMCSNGKSLASTPDPTNCPVGNAYLRSAVVSVVAHSDNQVNGAPQQTFEIESGSPSVANHTVTCGPDVYCTALTQEVLLPNLKDR